MGAHRLVSNLLRSRTSHSSDYFREQSFMVLVAVTALPAWLWIGFSLQAQRLDAAWGIGLMGLVALTCWLTYLLHRDRYLAAVYILLSAETVYIGLMLALLREPTIGYLFTLVVVTGTLLGPYGAFVVAATVSTLQVVLACIAHAGAFPLGLLTAQIVLNLLVAGVSAQVALGLHDALVSAEQSAQEASRQVEEARRHRGELNRALKSLDLAWSQLQRANSELFQAREVADAALRFKREFAAQISHELRTSLNLVLGFSETMAFSQNSYGVKLPAPYLRDVTEIYRNSQHLLALIDDVLDLSRLDAGRMGLRREPVDLAPMLREATEIARPLVERKGLALVLDVPPALPLTLVDRTRIRQVVLNLLSNAVRATSHGQIVVRAVRDGDQIRVEVRDTGIGIAPADLERVFEEFLQVEGTQGAAGAAGLGLAVSKRIVTLHGGRMWAESQVGVGSTFAFALPLPERPAYTDAVQTRSPAPIPPQPAVVVTAEPGADEVRLLERHLEGYQVAAAPTVHDALDLAAQGGVRAVIVNASFAEILDAPLRSQTVPLIACPLPGPEQARNSLGVSCFLQKPIKGEELRSALQRVAPAARYVLVVDDDPNAVRLIERMLQGPGTVYEVARAYSGREALKRAQTQRPDAIVLDLAMEAGNGQWLIAALRQKADMGDIPIVVTTGRPVEELWRSGPIGIISGTGFTPTETLRYLQALLSAVPPAMAAAGNVALPS